MANADPVKRMGECSACGACAAVCPKYAISMQEDADGYIYPAVDAALCVHCGLCAKVCDRVRNVPGNMPLKAYAAAGKDASLVGRSASGGVFASLARAHMEDGGMAAGAVMNMDGGVQVYHILSGDGAFLSAMQGSKYVQSDAWRCYAAVKEALSGGNAVLFSGTPCQVAAIKEVTGNPENLITMDIVCHGVPPVRMLGEYIRILERRFLGSIVQFFFRDKGCERNFCARIDVQRAGKRKSYYLNSSLLSYYKYFLSGVIYRESCYACPYANLRRVSDLTIGDYWGIAERHSADFAAGKMEKRKDWSFVLVNTDKGRAFLEKHAENMTLFPTQEAWIAQENAQLNRPSVRPAERQPILELWRKGGWRAIEADFIRKNGGAIRYSLRMIKKLHANRQQHRSFEHKA